FFFHSPSPSLTRAAAPSSSFFYSPAIAIGQQQPRHRPLSPLFLPVVLPSLLLSFSGKQPARSQAASSHRRQLRPAAPASTGAAAASQPPASSSSSRRQASHSGRHNQQQQPEAAAPPPSSVPSLFPSPPVSNQKQHWQPHESLAARSCSFRTRRISTDPSRMLLIKPSCLSFKK
ncbi:hypothetical protein AABB24_037177, partial [Solanum stoloniferum]